MTKGFTRGLAAACLLAPLGAQAQTATNLAVLKGLAPLTTPSKTAAGRAALGASFAVTGGLQTGTLHQSTLLPFAAQGQQALRDAFITDGTLSELGRGRTTSTASISPMRRRRSPA